VFLWNFPTIFSDSLGILGINDRSEPTVFYVKEFLTRVDSRQEIPVSEGIGLHNRSSIPYIYLITAKPKGLFDKNVTVPLGDHFCWENGLLSISKRREMGHV